MYSVLSHILSYYESVAIIKAKLFETTICHSFSNSVIHGDDITFQKYRCPLFKSYVITVSGLDTHDRQEIQEVVEKEGRDIDITET